MEKILDRVKYIKNNYLIETIILIVIAIILINTLFLYPVVGKIDNGDFERLMRYGGLSNLSNEYDKAYDGFLHTKYLISNPGILIPFYTDWISGTILLKVAILISFIIHNFNSNLFDIRYLSFVYCVAFLLGVFLIVSFKRLTPLLKIIAGAFIVLFFTSTCYITYFNSFFGEAGIIVFFFLNVGTYLYLITRDKPRTRHFVYFFIASGGFLTSKSQVIPLLVCMIVIYGALYIYYKEKKYRKNIIIGSLIVVLLCTASYFSLTDTMNENNIYQSVFSGVLRDSKTPQMDLQELGIDKKFMVFYGHSFYNDKGGHDPVGKEMLQEFYPNVSFGKVLIFYLRHLDRLWEKIVDSANNDYDFSNLGRWNFTKGQYNPNKRINNFRVKIIKKFPNIHHNIYSFIGFSIAYLAVAIFYFIKCKDRVTRLLILMLLFILASGASQLVLPVIGSGHGDFGKHLFLLNFSYDIMLGIALLWIVNIICKIVTIVRKIT
ncbi:hypothetical protein [Clostridium sp.]|uniref:glycan biosynthesis hexose transferase WsfD n=1 Tax=Clostridium sp. TaxID=1506 RepID=UPI002590E489|nr:hypothetical protein [Clostridium sp.]MDF2503960.1 hypothetical protein [Clostridium sp.]